ncbi:MAG: SCO family protein [Rhodobacteraceae bacterium]|nr:SCO family protein [Paracoccaceae bacterium]
MPRIFAIAAAFVILSLLAITAWLGGWRAPHSDVFAQCRQGQIAAGRSAIGGPLELVSEDGAAITDADLFRLPTLLYFGYTFCPDVCPLDAARNAEAVDLLEQRGHLVQPALITLDPERDTPEVLAEYTDYLHPRMIGLGGSPAQIKAAAMAYKVYYRKQDAEDEFYLVDHSTFSYLVLPEAGFVEYFPRTLGAEQVADAVACFLDRA